MGIDGLPLPAEGSTCRDGGDGSSRARTLPLRPLADGGVLLRHEALAGDVGRARQVKDAPVRDWVELAAARARVAETPAVFCVLSASVPDSA
jgi:monomeric isocitrate dehydrogenase